MRSIEPDAILDEQNGTRSRAHVGEAWAEANRRLRAALADPAVLEVWVTVGCPGSGKSRWLADQPDTAGVVAFDAVHSTPARRRSIAKRIRDAGKLPIAVVVTVPLALAVARNAERSPERRVPEAVLRASWGELLSWPVQIDEGWSDVWWVAGTDVRVDRRTTQEQDARAGRVVYRWRTAEDERVRPEHAARHGRLYSWQYPPRGGHAGEDFGCRCWPEMVRDEDVVETRTGELRARPLTVPTWARRR